MRRLETPLLRISIDVVRSGLGIQALRTPRRLRLSARLL